MIVPTKNASVRLSPKFITTTIAKRMSGSRFNVIVRMLVSLEHTSDAGVAFEKPKLRSMLSCYIHEKAMKRNVSINAMATKNRAAGNISK